MESVECAECSTRYDSEENAFCPRCGSMRPAGAVPQAVASAARRDPRRRRVRTGGIVLVAFGAPLAILSVFAAVQAFDGLPPESLPLLADQPGGAVVVTVVGAGGPANVTVADLDGRELGRAAWEGAPLRFESPDHAAVNVSVATAGGTWSRAAFAPSGDEVPVAFDLGQPAGHDGEPVASRSFLRILGGLAAAFAATTLAMVAGGWAALRMRAVGLALAGAVAGLLVGLVAVAAFQAIGLLFLLPLGYAFVAILRGRGQFGSAA